MMSSLKLLQQRGSFVIFSLSRLIAVAAAPSYGSGFLLLCAAALEEGGPPQPTLQQQQLLLLLLVLQQQSSKTAAVCAAALQQQVPKALLSGEGLKPSLFAQGPPAVGGPPLRGASSLAPTRYQQQQQQQ
ncbi:hypothetical protein Emed_002029 [Eimeria media]